MQQPKPTKTTTGNLARQLFGAAETNSPYSAAMDYLARGWRVIPLKGNEYGKDYNAGKIPAIRDWQTGITTQANVTAWFADGRYSAMGIALGAPSHLCVIEFDDHAKQAAFMAQFPHLVNTRRVLSGKRRGYHFYYHLPDELLHVESHNIPNIGEFKANGQQVVAPPTTIKGYSWELENDVNPLTLTKGDHEAALEFLGVRTGTGSDSTDNPAPLVMLPKPIDADGLVSIYETCRQTLPRNNSAYTTALKARSALIPVDDTLAALAAVFITDPAPEGHSTQTEADRYTELQRTVASAYGVKPSSLNADYVTDGRGLPNSVREYLLQNKQANAARVLDMLLMTGLQPGQRFTERAAVECGVLCGIGHVTVRKALDWLEQKQGEITVLRTGAGVANAPGASLPQNQLLSDLPIYTVQADITMLCTWQIGEQLKRGVKSKVFTLPDSAELAAVLGVQMTPADKIELDDLKSAKAYRIGLQRALIKRSEDMPLGRKWQANRLGVSVRTVYSYDEPAGIEAIPQEQITPIYWHNIDRVPIDAMDANQGAFLRVSGENRAPRRKTAMDALAAKLPVEYVQRTANKYRLKPQPDSFDALAESLGAVIVKGDSHE